MWTAYWRLAFLLASSSHWQVQYCGGLYNNDARCVSNIVLRVWRSQDCMVWQYLQAHLNWVVGGGMMGLR